ncbi:MAG: hypothetical protein H7258_13115 [Ferruginibacter sp.]|nr:hypothetical protein [Ferruginibacter sp.]
MDHTKKFVFSYCIANFKYDYGLTYSDFVVPLVKAVQEQQEIIDDQNKKIEFSKEMQAINEKLRCNRFMIQVLRG